MKYQVKFTAKPRGYKIGKGPDAIAVPSVTTVLGILDKPALVWWSQTQTLKNLCALHGEEA